MSTEKFLYDELDTLSNWGGIPKILPDSLVQNLNLKYELRPCQRVGRTDIPVCLYQHKNKQR